MKRTWLPSERIALWIMLAGLLAFAASPRFQVLLGLVFHNEAFFDSYAVLAASDAAAQGLDIERTNPLDKVGRGHSYSDWWLGLRWLGLTRADNFLFGAAIGLLFLATVAATLRARSVREAVLLAGLLLSPPVLFGLHRANNDLVVFALLGAGVVALGERPRPAELGLFGLGVVLATGLKFYPIVAAGALGVALPWRRATALALGGTTLAALAVLASQHHAMGRALFAIPEGLYQFGAALAWQPLGWHGRGLQLLAFVLLGLGGGLCARRWTQGLGDEEGTMTRERLLFAAGALLLLGCFVAGISQVYRLIFLLWLWPWLWRQAVAGRMTARVALALVLAVAWLDGLLCLVVNGFALASWPVRAWHALTQGTAWLLMLLLAGWLLEAFAARWTTWRRYRSSAASSSAAVTR